MRRRRPGCVGQRHGVPQSERLDRATPLLVAEVQRLTREIEALLEATGVKR
jgi:hypothetical protein